MADSSKTLEIVLKGRDDGAAMLFDKNGKALDRMAASAGKLDRRLDGLDRKLSTVGKITGQGIFRQAGDVAEGLDSKLGGLGKGAAVVGGFAIAGVAGREFQKLADGIDKVSAKLEGGAGFKELSADMARVLPGIGPLVKGFDDMRESADNFFATLGEQGPAFQKFIDIANSARGVVGMDKIRKQDSIGDMMADADKVNKTVDANYAKRNAVLAITADDGKDVAAKGSVRALEAERNAQLKLINDTEKQKLINQEQAEAARQVVIQKSEMDISRVRQEEADKRKIVAKREADDTLAVYKQMGDAETALRITLAEKAGDVTKAALERSRAEAKNQVDAINAEIEKIAADKSMTPEGRDAAITARRTQIDGIQTNQGIREKMIVGEGAEAAARKVFQIRATALENEANAGNKAAEVELRRLQIVERYKTQREEIERLERDSTLTAEQRLELEQRKAALVGQEKGELSKATADAGRDAAMRSVQTQLGVRTNTFDGRGQTASFNQMHSYRGGEQHASTTATAATKIAANSDKQTALIEKLVAQNAELTRQLAGNGSGSID